MLSAGERTAWKKRVRGAKTACRDRRRAQIALAAARGHPNAQTARPFSWKLTASDPHGPMHRISRHQQQDNPQNEPLRASRMTTPANFQGHPLKD
jgi:hypothetical protein